jgi:hypothetical protein
MVSVSSGAIEESLADPAEAFAEDLKCARNSRGVDVRERAEQVRERNAEAVKRQSSEAIGRAPQRVTRAGVVNTLFHIDSL